MPSFPEILELELSNRCNLDCVMCPRLPQKMKGGTMTAALLDRVLDEALAVPGRLFRLHGIGEPLLAPTFRHAVERIMADERGHRLSLITNGHLLDRDMARFLLSRAVTRITVSVAAATAATYEKVRRSPDFAKVVRNTLRLIDERDRLGSPSQIEVQIVRVPPADQEVEAFVDFWSRFDVTVEVWHDLNWGRRATGVPPSLDLEPCHHLWDYTVVCWDGRVGICCIDGSRWYVVGNAVTQSIAEIYNGPCIESIRELHKKRRTELIPICVDCSFRDQSHIAFSSNVRKTGLRPGPLLPVPILPVLR